jgi:hypothetical protein
MSLPDHRDATTGLILILRHRKKLGIYVERFALLQLTEAILAASRCLSEIYGDQFMPYMSMFVHPNLPAETAQRIFILFVETFNSPHPNLSGQSYRSIDFNTS